MRTFSLSIYRDGIAGQQQISVNDGENSHTELSYDRDHDVDTEVPVLRLLCARLAATMAVNSMADVQVVTLWLKTAQEDPLPEVRHAVPNTFPTPAASQEAVC